MITLIAVLAAGVFAGWMSMREEDGYMRSEILRQARLFAETVNIGGIRTLKGDATDLSRPEYRRLKDQFTAAAGIFRGSRFLYLIGRRPGGDVFFYLDSERPGSEDESPPGQVYPESDPRFLPVFEENRPVATGPVSDRWGTWISAWYPVVDPASGAAAAAIGIDFDAEYWRQAVREAAILPNIVAALLAAMIYAGFITIKGRETMEEDTKLGFRHAEAVLVLYLGILVSLVTAQFMHGQDLKRQRESFESLSDAYSTELNIRIHRVFGQSLRALGGFIEASDLITRDEFHVFAGYFSNAPGVESALWIPAVSRKDRISFEKSAGSEYGRKFFIRDRNGEGGFSPAGDRQNYFPILYSWPDVPAENIIRGIDPSSDPAWKEPMAKSAETGLETASVVPFPPSVSSSPRIAAFRPVFGGGGTLEGYAVLTLRPDFLVNTVLDGGQGLISMRLWRFMPDGEPQMLADSSLSDLEEAHFVRKEISSGGDLCCIWPVLFLGETYIAEVHPGDGFYTRHPSRTGWITLISGILITLTVAFLVHSIVRREEILEKKVDQRTAQLRESESRFRSLIEDAPFPVAVITPDGTVLFSNAQASVFFGVPAASAIGKNFTEEYSILEHPENFPGFVEMLRSQGSIRGREAHFRKPDGSSIWGLLSARAFLFGEREAILVALQDITERKTLMDRLQLSSKIFSTTSEGILVTNASGVIEDCNPAFEKLTGYSLEEIQGKKTEMFSAQKESREDLELYRRAIMENGVWQGEMWNRHKNGEPYPVWATVSSVKDAQGVTTHYATILTHIGAIKEEQLRLGHLASHDLLTGLPNRMLLLDRLEMGLARADRDGSLVAVIFIDLDGFKEVNDVYGHETGDILLASVAERLSGSIREQDTAARYGGDEFVIVLDGLPGIEDANAAFHRIFLAFCVPFDVRGMALSIGGSMGMSLFPMDGNDAGELLSKADMRMYREKKKNKTAAAGTVGETGAGVSPTRETGGVFPGI